jgi:hypothetical protein
MIVGNPNLFALESEISDAYERLSLRALGFFVIHVGGRSYGIKAWDATMLSIAFDGVGKRIVGRGSHNVPAISDTDAETLAMAYSSGYLENEESGLFFGMRASQFRELVNSKGIVWAPDGEEGFDDGSCVLQFDVGKKVRLVAFSRATNPLLDPDSLRDVWLPQDDFYSVLQRWYESFEDEWRLLPKQSDTGQ